MDTSIAAAVAAVFTWLGMVLAISFIEAPLKFGAPGVTLQIGLGIGRRVFRALNGVELLLAVLIGTCLLVAAPSAGLGARLALGAAALLLVGQLAVVRPVLARRSDAVLAGHLPADAPPGAGAPLVRRRRGAQGGRAGHGRRAAADLSGAEAAGSRRGVTFVTRVGVA